MEIPKSRTPELGKTAMYSSLESCWVINNAYGKGRCPQIYNCQRRDRNKCQAMAIELEFAERAYRKEINRTKDIRKMCRIQEIYDNRIINLNTKYGGKNGQ